MMVDHSVMPPSFPTAVGVRAPRLRIDRSNRRFLRIVVVLCLVLVIFLMNVLTVAARASDWRFGV